MLDRISLILSRLVEPQQRDLTPEQRDEARMIAMAALTIWFISALGVFFTLPYSIPSGMTTVFVVIAAVCSFGIPYFLARKGHIRGAILSDCLLATAAIFAVAYVSDNRLAERAFYYLITISIYCATFLSVRTGALVTVVYCIALLFFAPGLLDMSLESVLTGVFAFNALAAGFILLFVHFWRQREQNRRDALGISEARYRAISEHMSDYMFYARLFGHDERAILWETEQYRALTGYSEAEWQPNRLFDLIHPDDRSRILAGRALVRRGEHTLDEVRMTRRDGVQRWIRVERVPVKQGEKVEGYYGIVVDITEQKHVEEQQLELSLRRAQFGIIDAFVRAISHDFRNRLATVETTCYMIGRQVDAESLQRIHSRLDVLHDNVKDMITQLNNLSMINALNYPVLSPTEISPAIVSLIDKHRAAASERGLSLVHELSQPSPVAMMDAAQIERALSHLISNAIAHTNAGSVIVRSWNDHDAVVVEVEDTGEGISAEKLPHIFEPFFRADEARTTSEGGVGLGLTLVKLIVEAHCGTIAVDSQVGRGSRFTLKLPYHVPATNILNS
jgi:PAS domain S-box-containing protein